ncbi:MAG: hypothetical protein FWH12_08055 [Treponema sp.]|nr:hypothetical protein [Treponema sp.]
MKSYLVFLDRSVLFKKPISCFYALASLILPFSFLGYIIQWREAIMSVTILFIASVCAFLVLLAAGLSGALIWWHRRISRDEGQRFYPNLRRFIQTLGEWAGTVFAITVFGMSIVYLLFVRDHYTLSLPLISLPVPIPFTVMNLGFGGPIFGFLLIIATKIFLFILDLLVKLLGSIWKLLLRIVLYYYRCVVKIHRTIEVNTQIWAGVLWIISAVVVGFGIYVTYRLMGSPFNILLAGLVPLALGLGFMAFLAAKRRNPEA